MNWADFDAEIARFKSSTHGASADYIAALEAWAHELRDVTLGWSAKRRRGCSCRSGPDGEAGSFLGFGPLERRLPPWGTSFRGGRPGRSMRSRLPM